MRIRLVDSLDAIDAAAWDALAGEDDPFAEHAFLHTLEASGSVGPGTGWQPVHVTLYDGEGDEERLVGALPLYLKEHSYGEYIFDWGWADASYRAGLPYYPKLVSMAPVTPATGTRLLVHPEAERDAVVMLLLNGALAAADELEASSLHLLFLSDAERDEVIRHPKLMPRLTMQFHWHNEGYATFDDFVGRFRSSMRKKLRKERRVVRESGIEVRVLEGAELGMAEWEQLRHFYRDTCMRKGSGPYLTNRFFDLAADTLRKRAVAVMAYEEGEPVAATLNFEKGAHLYGRYWGTRSDLEMLHFELCYYQLIERAIDKGMRRFEAGAQGTHKLRRGLMPAKIHSAHWVRHPALRQAIQEFLPREAMSVQMQMEELADHGPFKRG